ncbi:MAG: very short patch repair endonuclease [Bacteroidales bacterium]|jgi:DNA mismatch endonuclease (patch repair protein)
MADVHNTATRSYNMSQIKSKDTKPELLVRRFLFSKGLRYRLHVKNLPGKPDIVFPSRRTAIFIHGCFWHGHEDCRYFVIPKTRTDWWVAKINGNKKLDVDHRIELENKGWTVIEIFECQLKRDNRNMTLTLLSENLNP